MHVRHIVAAALIGVLLFPSISLAQNETSPDIRTIPQEQALLVLLSNLRVGAGVQLQLASGERVSGRLVEKSSEHLVVSTQPRRPIAMTDVVDARAAQPIRYRGMTGGQSFGIGAAAGFGATFAWLMLAVFSS